MSRFPAITNTQYRHFLRGINFDLRGPAVISTYRISCVDQFPWLAELDHALLQVVQWTLHEHLLFFVVRQQMIPQLLLRKNFGIPHDDDAKPKEINSTGIIFIRR